MDDTVARFDVLGDDLVAVDLDVISVLGDGYASPVQHVELRGCQLIGRDLSAVDDVVFQDTGQFQV